VKLEPAGHAMSSLSLTSEFTLLETQLLQLISLCSQLRVENRSLLDQQSSLLEERARLIQKNELARAKVEQMIVRLKSMEAGQ
jgi:cell division protein ZapB